MTITELDADLQKMFEDFPLNELVLNGQSYWGIAENINISDTLEYGGFNDNSSAIWHGQYRHFDILPEKGNKVTMDGIDLRINDVNYSPDKLEIRLNLGKL